MWTFVSVCLDHFGVHRTAMLRWCCSTEQERAAIEVDRKIDKMLREHARLLRRECSMCIIGMDNSGKTTLFRQMQMIHEGGYSVQYRKAFAETVFQNVFTAIKALTEAMITLNIPYTSPENQLDAQWIQDVETRQVTTLEAQHTDAIRRLWADPGIRTCYGRRREFQLLDSTEYFMNNLDRIAAPGYVPTDQDVLRAKTNNKSVEYSFDTGEHFLRIFEPDLFHHRRFRHIMMEANFFIFVASLSEYDQFGPWSSNPPDPFEHLVREGAQCFCSCVNNRCFRHIPFILFLNKMDILAEKIQTSDLQIYFPEFTGKKGDAEAAMDFIRGLYLSRVHVESKQLYVHFTCAIDTESIRQVFNDIKGNIHNKYLKNCLL
ncbi:guanine nucleotide-binding protein subunit alpha-14-like [Anguilla rostrata]|uniref:guanine nucleotide-binding protein subunit alpha-14-like n=1 Tax=Anguilla rostrata TaxID=7938 RepID=UPI0030D1BA11